MVNITLYAWQDNEYKPPSMKMMPRTKLLVWIFRYKNGREVHPNDRISYSYEEASACLTIKPSESGDAGNYMCSAQNKLGSCDTEATLTVHRKWPFWILNNNGFFTKLNCILPRSIVVMFVIFLVFGAVLLV